MPDYQGVGIGNSMLNKIAQHYKDNNYRFTIVTTTPALIYSFQKNDRWHLYRQGRVQKQGKSSAMKGQRSTSRLTTAWEFK